MLSENLTHKLEELRDRHEEIAHLLADAEVVADQQKFTALSKEYSKLTPVVHEFESYLETVAEIAELRNHLDDHDRELRTIASESIEELNPKLESQTDHLQRLLLPKDPNDTANVFLEIRAGTGGEEAGLFAGSLKRMYLNFATKKAWVVEVVDESPTEIGGYKQVVLRIQGDEVFGQLKFEAGTHRVQRVPKTESQGRIHTSACTVAVLPEGQSNESIEIEKSDLRIDTFRASGAGGQHVNKTDSAVRITHLPSGIVVACQQERSQLRNREQAMSLLAAKLKEIEDRNRENEEAADRRAQIGSGDRSERIRTYNFPQGRLTDHRIDLTLYKLDEILEGSLQEVIEPLIVHDQADRLRELKSATHQA